MSRSSPVTESAARSVAEIIDPVAFDPISLKDSHPSWQCRRESAIETANKILALTQAAPLRMCGLCGTWNSKPCGNQCGFQITDPTYEQMAFANAAEAAGLAQTAQQWRPIETAPKDGTVVMIWLPHSTKMVCAYFESADKGWWVRHGAFCAENPTLWQPLPALPDTSTDQDDKRARQIEHGRKRPAQNNPDGYPPDSSPDRSRK